MPELRIFSVLNRSDHLNLTKGLEVTQEAIANWIRVTFGPKFQSNTQERARRLVEEALELGQACGVTKSEVMKIADYVYIKPADKVELEACQTLLCLLALCDNKNVNIGRELLSELNRIDSAKVRNACRKKARSKQLQGTLLDSKIPEDEHEY